MADTQRDLLDEDGENRALRSFLMQYGLPGLTVGAMRDHMSVSGWGAEYMPFFVSCSNRDAHLTKAGAQLWIRHLLGMEVASRPAEVDDEGLPALPEATMLGTSRHGSIFRGYTADQFRQGQRDAVASHIARQSSGAATKVSAPSHTTNKEKGDANGHVLDR